MDDSRTAYLNELNSFINQSKSKMRCIYNTLGWAEENILSKKDTDEPENAEHNGESEIISETEPFNSHSVEPGVSNEPKDSEKLYNEIMANLPKTKSKEDKEKTLLELLAAERDAKRRRTSYKNKVHTKNKSHTEILKEVIQQQMLAFEDWVSKEDKKGDEESRFEKEENAKETELIELPRARGNPWTVWKRLDEVLAAGKEADKEERSRSPERRRDWRREGPERRRESSDWKHKSQERRKSWGRPDRNKRDSVDGKWDWEKSETGRESQERKRRRRSESREGRRKKEWTDEGKRKRHTPEKRRRDSLEERDAERKKHSRKDREAPEKYKNKEERESKRHKHSKKHKRDYD